MKLLYLFFFAFFTIIRCGSDKETTDIKLSDFEMVNGIGPIKELISDIKTDSVLAEKGQKTFKTRCTACHRLDKKLAAPPLRYIVTKRSNEYILNAILNPVEMALRHPEAQKHIRVYGAQMTPQFLKKPQAIELLHFFHLKATEGKSQNIPDSGLH